MFSLLVAVFRALFVVLIMFGVATLVGGALTGNYWMVGCATIGVACAVSGFRQKVAR